MPSIFTRDTDARVRTGQRVGGWFYLCQQNQPATKSCGKNSSAVRHVTSTALKQLNAQTARGLHALSSSVDLALLHTSVASVVNHVGEKTPWPSESSITDPFDLLHKNSQQHEPSARCENKRVASLRACKGYTPSARFCRVSGGFGFYATTTLHNLVTAPAGKFAVSAQPETTARRTRPGAVKPACIFIKLRRCGRSH